MSTVLFVCLHNAGRSQMSQALFEQAAQGRHQALSAGSVADPDGRVHPRSSRSWPSWASTSPTVALSS
jgi:protein-tyrosine-phosphatase